jgi:hypothetical protein
LKIFNNNLLAWQPSDPKLILEKFKCIQYLSPVFLNDVELLKQAIILFFEFISQQEILHKTKLENKNDNSKYNQMKHKVFFYFVALCINCATAIVKSYFFLDVLKQVLD